MKKTIAALALSASSTSFALMIPPEESKTICLEVYETSDGVLYAGTCDMSANNEEADVKILENGCAEGQIALESRKYGGRFDINIASCLPPNVIQL